jgi:LPXTG-site transpeptidase (sortase) family protein
MTTRHAHVIERPWVALAVFLLIFFLLSVFLFAVDFVPEVKTVTTQATAQEQTPKTVTVAELTKIEPVHNVNLIAGPTPAVMQVTTGLKPTRIVVTKVGVDTPVLNPVERDLASLDQALLSGAVRYPGTAHMNEEGSVVIFGHQSYLPVVRNQAFKAFNDLQELVAGDVVSVFAGDIEFRYAVRDVELKTTDAGSIALPTKGQTLTLVTCNSLGAKEERYIITADLIGTYSKN